MAKLGQKPSRSATLVSTLPYESLKKGCVPFPPCTLFLAQAGHVTLSLLSWLGTYNNQYMVLDLKRVKLQKSLDDGALYIVEQIPTLVEYSDQTNILRKGNGSYTSYWLRKAISLCQLMDNRALYLGKVY